MTDRVSRLSRDWDALAADDPYWAVLSHPDKRGGGWDAESFFQTGRDEVTSLLDALDALGARAGRSRALDFGCGPGRLVQAFAEHYETVDGVDISERMIELARRVNRHGNRCTYHVNARADLSLFGDDGFDLVHSTLTLQHIPAPLSLGYISEFARVVRPGGVVVFDIPAKLAPAWRHVLRSVTPRAVRRALFRRRYGVDAFMDMNPLPRRRVLAHLDSLGLETIAAEPSVAAGVTRPGFRYISRKPTHS